MNISFNKTLLAGLSGTVLQWYDFALFSYFASFISQTYFPNTNPLISYINTFSVFAVGYLLAPLGSLFFGFIGDNFGRKQALSLSILAMTIPTALISIIPSYHRIGIIAPLVVTLLRLIQGFVASSEFTGSAIFLVEHAKPEQKAFYGCLTSSAYSLGLILAGLSSSFFTASFMPAWGWRLGFTIALIAGFLIFYLRKHISETPDYQQIAKQSKTKAPFLIALKEKLYAIVGVIGIAWLISILTFGSFVFMATYLHHFFKLTYHQVTLIITLSLATDACLEPLIATRADKVGFLKIIRLGIALVLILSLPLFYLLASCNLYLITLAMILMAALIAITYAPLNAYMISLFPEHYRYSGFGVSFNLGIALFGGTTPLVMMWLVHSTHNLIAPAWYYLFGALIGLLSLALCEYSQHLEVYAQSILTIN